MMALAKTLVAALSRNDSTFACANTLPARGERHTKRLNPRSYNLAIRRSVVMASGERDTLNLFRARVFQAPSGTATTDKEIEGMYSRRSGYSQPTVLGISEKWERVLCYVGGWVTGIIFLLIEQKNVTVRRHAMQSLIIFSIFSVLLLAVGLLSHIWVIGLLFWLLGKGIWAVGFCVWLFLMVAAFLSPKTFLFHRMRSYL